MNDDDPFANLKPAPANVELAANVVRFPEPPEDRFPPMQAYERDANMVPEHGGGEGKPDAPEAKEAVPPLKATPFVWKDPATIPPRPWVYGHHMIRRQVSVTVAPGGVGKSSLTLVEALAIATGRELLGEWVGREGLRVWAYNLEDPRDEMERRVIGAMMHHNVRPESLGEGTEGGMRLFIDSGRERPLCTAIDLRGEVTIVRPEIEALEAEIIARDIDVMIIDPFVSSHRVSENASGAIDLVAKEWARLADRTNCAIELVHHTRKTGGVDATTEDGRGSTALVAAARSARVLNKMSDEMREQAGVKSDPATIFGIDRDKANLAPAGARAWIRMASVDLGNGDQVGVAERWEFPDAFAGVQVKDLLAVQNEVQRRWDANRPPRFSDQSGVDWVGHIVAEMLELDVEDDKRRIKKILSDWMKAGALRKAEYEDEHRKKRPCVEVGEWASE